jgi:hypothetical protein
MRMSGLELHAQISGKNANDKNRIHCVYHNYPASFIEKVLFIARGNLLEKRCSRHEGSFLRGEVKQKFPRRSTLIHPRLPS